jgi:hypothetical protein
MKRGQDFVNLYMEKRENQGIDIEIDELTNSIKNVISGDSFPTDITRITKSDLKTITKKMVGNLIGN